MHPTTPVQLLASFFLQFCYNFCTNFFQFFTVFLQFFFLRFLQFFYKAVEWAGDFGAEDLGGLTYQARPCTFVHVSKVKFVDPTISTIQ